MQSPLENERILLENAAVNRFVKTLSNKTKKALLSIIVLLLGMACFADIRTELPSHRRDGLGLLPVDSRIGVIVQPDVSESHSFLSNALSSGEYGYEWMESFVLEASRSDVSTVLGTWLSDNLPLKGFLMSQALENGDGSVSINVRSGDDCLCFVVELVSLVDVEGEGASWFIVAAKKL